MHFETRRDEDNRRLLLKGHVSECEILGSSRDIAESIRYRFIESIVERLTAIYAPAIESAVARGIAETLAPSQPSAQNGSDK